MVIGNTSGEIYLREVATGTRQGPPIRAKGRGFERLETEATGTWVAAKISYERGILVLPIDGDEEPRRFAHMPRNSAFAFDPSGKILVTQPSAGVSQFWDIATGESVREIRVGPAMLKQVMYTPDGRHLVTVNGNGTVYVLPLAAARSAAEID